MTFQQVEVGVSETIDRVPTLEEQASDIRAVTDAEGLAAWGVLDGDGGQARSLGLTVRWCAHR